MNAERRKQIDKAANLLRQCVDNLAEARSLVEEAANHERDYFENMNDNLKGSEKGERAERAADVLDEIQLSLEEFDADDLVGKLEEAKE